MLSQVEDSRAALGLCDELDPEVRERKRVGADSKLPWTSVHEFRGAQGRRVLSAGRESLSKVLNNAYSSYIKWNHKQILQINNPKEIPPLLRAYTRITGDALFSALP